MKNGLVSVNILGFNMKRFLFRSITSIQKQCYTQIEINYIDNGSVDDSVSFVKNNFKDVNIIMNDANLGYSGGHNRGIERSTGNYIMLLNADIELDINCINERVKSIEKENKIGMAEGKLYRVNEDFNIDIKSRIIDSCGLYITKSRKNYEIKSGQIENIHDSDEERFIFGPFGACPVYKKEMLNEIKIYNEYLDEDFFLTREEVDLAWRAQLLGWKCIYNPKSIGYHVHTYTKESRKRMPKYQKSLQFRNRYFLIIKNDSLINILKDIHYILFYELIALFFVIFREPYLFYSYIDVVKLFPKMLKKRKAIRKKVVVSSKYIRDFFNRQPLTVNRERLSNHLF